MKYFLFIIRPFNCFFVGLAVLAGAFLHQSIGGRSQLLIIGFAVASAMFVAAGGYVINDYYDMSIDAVNKPYRVLPSGKMSPEIAHIYALILFVLGISTSVLTVNNNLILLALINSFLLYFYAKKLKRTVLLGNVVVAWAVASTFIYGAFITDNLIHVLPLFFYTFLYTITREIIKDAEDVKGDKKLGIKTIATCCGEKCAVIVSMIPSILLVVVLYFSLRYEILPAKIFYPIITFFLVPLIVVYFIIMRDLAAKNIRIAAAISKIHMLLLLIVYIWLS